MNAVLDEERKAYNLPKHRICPTRTPVPQNDINYFQDSGTAFWPSNTSEDNQKVIFLSSLN
jgi:hypothetical protein